MEKNIWHEKYSLHNEEVDKQHQYLFELANQASEASSKEFEIECAMNLFKHMREHFRDEELHMKQTHYTAFNEHVSAHNQLLDILVGLSERIADTTNFNSLNEFMQHQFLPHTLNEDMLFGKFLSQQR